MSFDVNIGRPEPIIKAAANMNNDGGSGGNTGYMMRGNKKNKDKNFKSLFEDDKEIDTFEMASKLPKKDFDGFKNSWFDNIVEKFIK